jgi:hypothetical protein
MRHWISPCLATDTLFDGATVYTDPLNALWDDAPN